MKNDTSNIIDLDNILNPKEEEKQPIVESVETPQPVEIDFKQIIEEWSYRCPKGFPTVVNGKIEDEEEIKILNEILIEHNLDPVQELIVSEAITIAQLSTNPTDVKEAMVCLFVDAGLTDYTILESYRLGLDKTISSTDRSEVVKNLKNQLTAVANKYGKNYGISGYAKMGDFVAQAIGNPQTYKADIIIINNGVGAADAIIQKLPQVSAGLVARDKLFDSIRSHAVKLIETNYNIKGYFPDNWCPGDIYFYLKGRSEAEAVLKTQRLNVGAGSLNSFFYGTTNPKGSILAVSLKMQKAQAGKGTTFIKNVVVDGVTPQDKVGKDVGNQQIIKFRDLSRRLEKYYFNSDDWKKDPKAYEKVKAAMVQLLKMAKQTNIPNVKDQKEVLKYLTENKKLLKELTDNVSAELGKSIDTATTFQQAYTRFVKNLQAMDIKKVEGNSKDFLKKIEDKNKQDNKGKLDTAKIQGLLSQKAATYDLASTLIEKWTEKTKRISPAFADHLKKVKNPFVAITMFAIAQHGLNPNFYKAIGRNDAGVGQLSEFPSNSVVDEKKSVQQLKVVDSPGQAGFYIEYFLTINNHTYRTTLTFRFSKDQIRVEVEELAQV